MTLRIEKLSLDVDSIDATTREAARIYAQLPLGDEIATEADYETILPMMADSTDQLAILDEGDVVAAATITIDAATKGAVLECFVVDKQVRSRGIGGSVLQLIAIYCEESGCDVLSLTSTLKAQEFYTRNGMQRTNNAAEPCATFAKDLTQ